MEEYKFLIDYVEQLSNIGSIKKKTRKTDYVIARRIIAKILRDNTSLSLNATGKVIGKDHATILHYSKMDYELVDNNIYKLAVKMFRASLINRVSETPIGSLKENERVVDETLLSEIKRLKDKIKSIKAQKNESIKDYINLKKSITESRKVVNILYDLTDQQIEVAKQRLDSYARLCRDQNRRNGQFVTKHENLR